jgi:sugar-specific transcriptional regulator TrmB
MTTQNDNLIIMLKGLGFSHNSAVVYLACLELGSSSIWEISKKSGIKRPTCYVILEELAWKGFASSSNDGKRVEYTVLSPKRLAQVEEKRHSSFISSISELQSIASQSREKPKITTFEGKEGINRVFELILEIPKNSVTYVIGDNLFTERYPDIREQFVLNRVKRNITSKAIFPNTPENQPLLARKDDNRKLLLLDIDKFKPNTQTNIFGDTVAYIVHGESEPFATVIQSAALAEDERQKFELIWQSANNSTSS